MARTANTSIPAKFLTSRTRRGSKSKDVSNASSVADDTHSYREDTISDTTVFTDISSIKIDDSGYLAGVSGNADLTVFNSPETMSSSSTMLEDTSCFKAKRSSKNRRHAKKSSDETVTSNESDYLMSMTTTSLEKDEDEEDEEEEEEEEQVENEVTVTEAESTYVVQPKDDGQKTPTWNPLAESTRITPKTPNGLSTSRSFVDSLSCTSLFVIEEDDREGLSEADYSKLRRSNQSGRLTRSSSKGKTMSSHDTTVIDNTTTTKEASCKPRCSGKKEPGTFSQDTSQDDVDGDALYAEIRKIYIAYKKKELQNGRPHSALEMEQFELEIKKVVQKFCEE